MTVLDWVLAERIARYVAGSADGRAPVADLDAVAAESEKRVTAYTGLKPTRPLPPPEGISRREWVQSNIGAMRELLDPVLERAGEGLGPLRPAMQIGIGLVLSTEVGVVVGYLAQRVLGQYELVLLEEVDDRPPRRRRLAPGAATPSRQTARPRPGRGLRQSSRSPADDRRLQPVNRSTLRPTGGRRIRFPAPQVCRRAPGAPSGWGRGGRR